MEKPQKHQILMVWGGEAFATTIEYLKYLEGYKINRGEDHKSWKNWLLSGLSDDFEWIRVSMPDTNNSYYPAWKIWFEKYFEYLGTKKLVVIGHSLGGIFLAKYLSENTFPRCIDVLHLVSPVYDNDWLQGESTASFSLNTDTLSGIYTSAKEIHIWHSKDDAIVPYEHSMKYHTSIKNSILHTFNDRGHFSGQSHFVELFLEIQKQI